MNQIIEHDLLTTRCFQSTADGQPGVHTPPALSRAGAGHSSDREAVPTLALPTVGSSVPAVRERPMPVIPGPAPLGHRLPNRQQDQQQLLPLCHQQHQVSRNARKPILGVSDQV